MFVVIGEALVDLVGQRGSRTLVAHPGGSPADVALGPARLGDPVSLITSLGGTPSTWTGTGTGTPSPATGSRSSARATGWCPELRPPHTPVSQGTAPRATASTRRWWSRSVWSAYTRANAQSARSTLSDLPR